MYLVRSIVVAITAVVLIQILPPLVAPTTAAAPSIADVAGGDYRTCAVTTSHGVKCWGKNWMGALGDGTRTARLTPVDVVGLGRGVATIAVGEYHSCALTNEGGVKCWGWNNWGQLGIGTTKESLVPVDVPGLSSGVIAIAAGSMHTCAVTNAGGVSCWGGNYRGQLGVKSPRESARPMDVPGLASGVTAIVAGGMHTCALTSSGGVKCWGGTPYGQLGIGTRLDSPSPVDVTGLASGVISIAAGYYHTCATTAVGGVKCWGLNVDGQLGDGTASDRWTPTDVAGLSSGATAVYAGRHHTCALTITGGIKCWGRNRNGQLGDGTKSERLTPVDVKGLGSGVVAISVSGAHTCAATSAGRLKCWGWNSSGQLGDGTNKDRHLPVGVIFPKPARP